MSLPVAGPSGSDYMDRAFELAELGRGRTNPNPMVGAVIVKDGRIVGEGWHAKAGGAHAEVNALNEARAAAEGAALYVTLEPCCHHGRTGPCTEAIIKSGVKEAIIGAVDPNPIVGGKGIQALRDAGLAVTVVDDARFAGQNEVYIKYVKTRKPFVLLKIAISLDGKIAAPIGARTNLTDTKAQLEVHKLRNEYQAVLVGINTVIIDNPQLSCRLEGDDIRQPIRVVVDSRGRLPVDSRLVRSATAGPVILAATDKIADERRRDLSAAGVEVMVCKANARGRVDIDDLLIKLGEREITSLLVEGGAQLNEELVGEGIADKMLLFLAPLIISGQDSLPMIAGTRKIRQAWRPAGCRAVGDDVMLEFYPVRKGGS